MVGEIGPMLLKNDKNMFLVILILCVAVADAVAVVVIVVFVGINNDFTMSNICK